ncbi:MAG: shikimate dehydrogenase family protein [Gemmatimonadota bacterium]
MSAAEREGGGEFASVAGPRRRYGLLGDPVSHSISPAIYAAAFRVLGVQAEYVTLRVAEEELPGAMRSLAASGGGNVTLPHKAAAATLLEWRSEDVSASGACNCFWLDARGRLAGDNTDVGGFLAALSEAPRCDLAGGRVLLLGAGGAARAVLIGCERAGAARIDVWNRSPDRARRLVEQFGSRVLLLRPIAREQLEDVTYELVVNATSLGLSSEDPLPLDLGGVRAGAAFDLVYRPGGTRWVHHARELGIPAQDGRGMLVHQAALAIERWLGIEAPLPAMREATEQALRSPRGVDSR